MEELQKRGPGRPSKYQEATAITAQEATTRKARASRNPFGSTKLKGDYPQRPGYHRHWFNDVPGRIQDALTGGYANVIGNDGKPVSQICGTKENGEALYRFLLEIPQEWYDEDMRLQQKEIDEKEAAIKAGQLNKQEGDGRYVPAQGISIKHG